MLKNHVGSQIVKKAHKCIVVKHFSFGKNFVGLTPDPDPEDPRLLTKFDILLPFCAERFYEYLKIKGYLLTFIS
jgi:hypothetical protein